MRNERIYDIQYDNKNAQN